MAGKELDLFVEDEVCKKKDDGGYEFGFVLENSEYFSSEDEEEDRLRHGTVKVVWHPEGNDAIETESKVILADRSLMPGDVIRKLIVGENSPRGFVQDTTMKCHLHIIGTNKYLYNVDTKDLRPLQGFEIDAGEVTMDSWVGRPEMVNQQIQVVFPDGARCLIMDTDLCMLECTSNVMNDESEFNYDSCYYRGQTFSGYIKDFRDARWLNQTKRHNARRAKISKLPVCVQVEDVTVRSVEVQWLCRGFTKMDDSIANMEHPPNDVKAKDLDRLHILEGFTHCGVQIGDKKKYVIKASDVMTEVPPKGNLIPDIVTRNNLLTFKDGISPVFTPVKSLSISSPECSKFSKNTLLMKLIHDENVDPDKSTEPSCDKDDTDNMSDEYESMDDEEDEVEETEKNEKNSEAGKTESRVKEVGTKKSKTKRKGERSKLKPLAKFEDINLPCDPGSLVAVEVCYTFSTANIMWQNGKEETGTPSPDLYPIHHLDELEFFPGDFVVDSKENNNGKCGNYGVVTSCDHLARTCMVRWMKTVDIAKGERPDETVPTTEVSVYDIKDHSDFKFRPGHTVIRVAEPSNVSDNTPAVGQVHRLDPHGSLHIRWPNGEITHCYPQELYIVGEEMSEFDSDSDWETTEEDDDDEEDSDASWETENEEEVDDDTNKSTTPDAKEAESSWFQVQQKREELVSFIHRAQTALSKLEAIFVNVQSDFRIQNPEQCFQDIIAIYRKCRELDRIIKSSYFDSPDIVGLIEDIRAKLRKEKCNKINRHLIQVFENRRGQSIKGQNGEGSMSQVSTSVQTDMNEESGICRSVACVQTDDSATGMEVQCEEVIHADVAATNDYEMLSMECKEKNNCRVTEETCDLNGDRDGCSKEESQQQSLCNGIVSNSRENSSDRSTTEKDTEKDTGSNSEATPPNDKSQQTDLAAESEAKTRDKNVELCSQICKQLRKQMTRMQEEVNKRSSQAIAQASSTSISPSSEALPISQEGDNVSPESAEAGLTLATTDSSLILKNSDPLKTENGNNIAQVSESMSTTEAKCEVTDMEVKSSEASESVTEKAVQDSDTSGLVSADCSVEVPSPIDCNSLDISTEAIEPISKERGSFILESEVPPSHNFRSKEPVTISKVFMTAVKKELKLLQSSLPHGITVKGFEDRVDLFSAMIMGPAKTPYEDAPFFFDIHLPADYPNCPPLFHYIAFCSDRLNPNLYEDGNVCVSLLGTWEGKDKENWTSGSNLLQVLVSIQGLILVAEPYFNEAGYERQKDTQLGSENSKTYNEMAILKLVQSVTKMIQRPPYSFTIETLEHIRKCGRRFVRRIEHWILLTEQKTNSRSENCAKSENTNDMEGAEIHNTAKDDSRKPEVGEDKLCAPDFPKPEVGEDKLCAPDFPFLPASRGFCITMNKNLAQLKEQLTTLES
ncbi:(E3-independent) E2 ubiquitin-conjugating enzyme-like [Ylistrum balloti]|uniref:(E3-independent) E2 ubiquitin-conjugating enzyme-like n=1 Tax=Ylistrum balloti TaxID=509963 RepID=UPI0029058871|nr:(E3-independent) E2 ubiquitin-conjugating enzyme-like [Ylistrum balloti]